MRKLGISRLLALGAGLALGFGGSAEAQEKKTLKMQATGRHR